jgi:hypothetical protein
MKHFSPIFNMNLYSYWTQFKDRIITKKKWENYAYIYFFNTDSGFLVSQEIISFDFQLKIQKNVFDSLWMAVTVTEKIYCDRIFKYIVIPNYLVYILRRLKC